MRQEKPKGWQKPGPRAEQNLQMYRGSPGGEGGGGRAEGGAQLELTDALFEKFY